MVPYLLRTYKPLWYAQFAMSDTTVKEAGRKGGSAKVAKGFAKMPKRKRREIARRAAAARWPNGAAK